MFREKWLASLWNSHIYCNSCGLKCFSYGQYDYMVNRIWLAIWQNWLLKRRQGYFHKKKKIRTSGQWAIDELCTVSISFYQLHISTTFFCVNYNSPCRKMFRMATSKTTFCETKRILIMLMSSEAWMIKRRSFQLAIDYSIMAGSFTTTHNLLNITFIS